MAKWKKIVLMICILCTMIFLFVKFREIGIEGKLDSSVVVSVSVREFYGLQSSLTEDLRFRNGSTEFKNLVECLGRYRYYKKMLPVAGINGKNLEEIQLTFWDEERHITTFLAIYSEGTVSVEGEQVRCISGFNSGKQLFLDLKKILENDKQGKESHYE